MQIAEKLSNLVHFDYFSSKALCVKIFEKIHQKIKSQEFFKFTVPFWKVIYFPKGVDLHKLYSWTKNFLEVSIL